jgi:hypothetical protein
LDQDHRQERAIVKTIASWSAGVDSTAMVLAILTGKHPELTTVTEIVMADTGSEKPETYRFAEIFRGWMAGRFPKVPITVLSWKDNAAMRNVPLHEYCLEPGRERLPSRNLRWCTDKAKITPITRYLRGTYPTDELTILIGYESTEITRAARGRNKVRRFKNRFPLMELGMNRAACEDLIRQAGLPVPIKSACFMCPFMKTAEVRRMPAERPSEYRTMLRMEDLVNERRKKEGKTGFYFKHKPLRELVRKDPDGTLCLFAA